MENKETSVNAILLEEILKLYLIIYEGRENSSFSREYLLEKIGRILSGVPISVHPLLQRILDEK